MRAYLLYGVFDQVFSDLTGNRRFDSGVHMLVQISQHGRRGNQAKLLKASPDMAVLDEAHQLIGKPVSFFLFDTGVGLHGMALPPQLSNERPYASLVACTAVSATAWAQSDRPPIMDESWHGPLFYPLLLAILVGLLLAATIYVIRWSRGGSGKRLVRYGKKKR